MNDSNATQADHSGYLKSYTEFISESADIIQKGKKEDCFAVMYVDITDFQLVNDFYGFEEGDRFLQALADFLLDLPRTQICARVFSDHFIRLARFGPDLDIGQLTITYEKCILKFLEKQYAFHPNCKAHIACGYCVIEDGHESLVKAIDNANLARKEAKSFQRSKIIWFNEEMKIKIQKQKDLEINIQEALRREEFCFYLQPKVNLHTGKVIGAEALARWIRPDGSMVYPDEFIPIMEKNESITELDFLIYRKVCEYIQERIKQGKKVVPISVNMSRVNIFERGSGKRIHEIALKYQIPPHLLEFELTETVLLEEFAIVKQIMDELRGYGYKTSIDDFGSGFTGVNIWRELDFDVVKLDRNFISQNEQDVERNDIIVKSIVFVGNKFETALLSEGIETMEQCEHMRGLGCDIAQGYYFSRPVSVEKFEECLTKNNGYYKLPWVENNGKNLAPEYLETEEITATQMRSITHSLIHIMPCGMAGFDETSGKLMFLSDKLLTMLGYTREEFSQMKHEDWKRKLFPDNSSNPIWIENVKNFDKSGYLSVEYCKADKNGKQTFFSVYVARVSTPEFGAYVLCCFFDETAHKETAKLAKQMESKLNVLIDSFHGGVARVVESDSFRILEASDTYYEMTGYSREEFMGAPIYGYGKNLVLREDQVSLEESVRLMLQGKLHNTEYRIRKKDGSIVWNSAYIINAYTDNDTDSMIFDALFLDITKEKDAELEKVQLNDFYKVIYNSVDCAIIQYIEKDEQSDVFCCTSLNNYAMNLYGIGEDKLGCLEDIDIVNDFILEEDLLSNADRVRQLKMPGDSVSLEFRIKNLEGKDLLLGGTLKIISYQNGIKSYLGVLMDYTEKRQINQLKYTLNTVLENTPGDVVALHIGNNSLSIDYLTKGLSRVFGYTKDEFNNFLCNNNGMDLVYPEDRSEVLSSIFESGRGKLPIDLNFRVIYKNGTIGWSNLLADYCAEDESGNVVYHGIITNISRLKEQEEALSRWDLRYRVAAEIMDIDMWSYDFNKNMLDLPVTEKLSGLNLLGVTQVSRDEFLENGNIHSDYIPNYLALYDRIMQGEECVETEVLARVKQGGYQWFKLICKAVKWSEGKIVEMVGISENINVQKKNQEQLSELQEKAMKDSLTGLYNRAAAQKLIQTELGRKHCENGISAFLIMDIDNFKLVNDHFGHQAGDKVIQDISKAIKKVSPSDSILGRLGGDEFMLYIKSANYESDIHKTAQDICDAVNTVRIEGRNGPVTSISIGIALVNKDSLFAELYKNADDAMYHVKNSTRNNFAVYQS